MFIKDGSGTTALYYEVDYTNSGKKRKVVKMLGSGTLYAPPQHMEIAEKMSVDIWGLIYAAGSDGDLYSKFIDMHSNNGAHHDFIVEMFRLANCGYIMAHGEPINVLGVNYIYFYVGYYSVLVRFFEGGGVPAGVCLVKSGR